MIDDLLRDFQANKIHIAIVVDEFGGTSGIVKMCIRDRTYTLPPFQTACGIADMMGHIMERYFTNTQELEISDCLCEGTLTAIIKEAYRIKQNPGDYGARANICLLDTSCPTASCWLRIITVSRRTAKSNG